MAKHKKKTARSGSRPSKASDLKEQLKSFSSDHLVEIVEKFLSRGKAARRKV